MYWRPTVSQGQLHFLKIRQWTKQKHLLYGAYILEVTRRRITVHLTHPGYVTLQSNEPSGAKAKVEQGKGLQLLVGPGGELSFIEAHENRPLFGDIWPKHWMAHLERAMMRPVWLGKKRNKPEEKSKCGELRAAWSCWWSSHYKELYSDWNRELSKSF